MVAHIPGAVYRCDFRPDWNIRYISAAIEDISGFPAEDFVQSKVRTFASIIHPEDRRRVELEVQDAVEASLPYTLEYRIVTVRAEVRWIYERGRLVREPGGAPAYLDGVLFDHTLEHHKEDERSDLIQSLRQALAKVQTLQGLLPICSSCKSIRDDSGYWRQLESYIQSHTAAQLSHGICPKCADKLYANEPWFERIRAQDPDFGNSD